MRPRPSFRLLPLLLLGTLLSVPTVSARYDHLEQFQEFSSAETERALFPNIFNLATNSLIRASSTCGQTGPEEYCKLVEHVRKMEGNDNAQCPFCDANDVRLRHPIEFAIDGTQKWWQSPSLAMGLEYEKVNITIDLRQEYHVAYIVIRMGNSPRPGTWVLEKSLDGTTWKPWQFYAMTDAECMRQFGMPATTDVPRFSSDEEVICTSAYSKLDPLEDGEIHTSLVNGRPGVDKPSEGLQRFTRTRYVRMRLISPKTLNADLMIINQRSHKVDQSVTKRYFYSIKDISIGGQCICYGHAESCPPDPATGQFKCECRHNTCGESCNACCPLFNQLPWKPGTNEHPNVCQQCQCFNHADRCVFDEELAQNALSVTPEGIYEGGGRCIDCKHNTAGVNCERCKAGFYRPSGITHYREDACRPCECDASGSEHLNCVRDDQSAASGLHPGDCICRPGFGGRRCERCARGYRNYPRCEPCPCSRAGSQNFDTCEEESCVCKANVEGLYCDRCRPNTIHLSESNPAGCQACFCFGLSDNCTSAAFITGKITTTLGWNLTDLTGGRDVRPETENGDVLLFNANQNRDRQLYYWKAPRNFTGNLLNSYGGNLQYYVYYVPTEQGVAAPLADVIIEGNGIKLEYFSRLDFFPRENMTVLVPIQETTGWYNSQSRRPVAKDDMMRALAHVDRLLVRALYNQQQLQSSISGLSLDTAVLDSKKGAQDGADMLRPPVLDQRMRGVEVCTCPENFAGRSCESCAPGFRRVNNQLHGGQCVRCECEGHSDECDPFTGACLNCKHNTTGARCERCLPGHYGNPSLGGELGACRPCACPSLSNNHSPECALTQLVVSAAAAASSDAYVCTACETGYEGNKCESCADGFFGDPLAVNGTCVECECSGNIDPAAIGNCDMSTGRCLKCIGNTAGEHCEICESNHWGSAATHTCRSCSCHPSGAVAQQCDTATGACECKPNYIGKQCDRCKSGHGDVDADCPACDCNEVGALGKECDDVSGQCTCKQGVFGKRCDKCRPSYFNFTDSGCQFCHCNSYGSIEDGKCDAVTGKCECRENVAGNMCEKCADGFFNISSGLGCQACNCSAIGADGAQCDVVSGACACKPGVSGAKCEQCAPNHYGLTEEGCKECRKCPAPGQVCDPLTGECVCPPNTVGEMCEACTPDSWDYHPLRGCRPCDCNSVGASGSQCDALTGQCSCNAAYVGRQCDHCTHGFYSFPECVPCECAVAGTEERQCHDGICLCDENGQCPCKKNAEGIKCDKCRAHTFSLDESNRLGCTDCFCFSRSDLCVQSPRVWQQIYAEDRVATFAEPWEYYTKKHNLNLLKESPARFNSYPTDATPLYWPLPRVFLGDRTGSYNGFLRFKIWNDDNRRGIDGVRPDGQYFRYFPQVVLIGNNRIELEHIPWQISEDGKYKIRLHESEWRSRTAPDVPVTRSQLMIALQNLQGIYIRGTYNYPARGDVITISEISLDVAVKDDSASPLTTATAVGVEQCSACPAGYDGASCQNPAPGFCRRRHRDYLNAADDLVLVGWSEPCACNGHSTTCDPETCLCSGCEHNTMGDFCERCKPGYIGEAANGGPASCTKCACPLVENSFSETCQAVPTGRGYVCDACERGYHGQYCEICDTGYYGDPSIPGGRCTPCECHRDGSLTGECHPMTGQCACRPGVTGRDCSLCQERHAFINGICTSCDQGCYLPLMSMLDDIDYNLARQNFSGLRPIPWRRLARLQNDTDVLQNFVVGLGLDAIDTERFGTKSQYTQEATAVIDEARFDAERLNRSLALLTDLTNRTESSLAIGRAKHADAFNTTQFLAHFASHGSSQVSSATLATWAMEAEALYNATQERGDYIEERFERAEDEHLRAQDLLKRVLMNKLNDTSFEILNKRIAEFGQWLADYRETIYSTAKKDTADAEKMAEIVAKRIDRFKEVVIRLEAIRGDAEDSLAAAKDAIAQAKEQELLNMYDDYNKINETLEEVYQKTAECNEIAEATAQLIDEYDEKMVDPAGRHANELETITRRVVLAFRETKAQTSLPVDAARSYEAITASLQNASRLARATQTTAEEEYSKLVGQGNVTADLVEQVRASSAESTALLETADDALRAASRAGASEQKELGSRLEYVNEALIDIRKRIGAATGEWDKFDDFHDRVTGMRETSLTADTRASHAKKMADELSEQLARVSDSVTRLTNATSENIREQINQMKKARQSLDARFVASEQAARATDASRVRLEGLQGRLAALKEKIGEAREKAAQINIGLRGDAAGRCRRSFLSPSAPSPATSLQIRFAPLRGVPDSLLLLSKTIARRTVPSEYIAIEIRDKRVIAHWNVGSGARMVTNSHPINYTPNKNAWYVVDFERAGNSVNLTLSYTDGVVEGTGVSVHLARSEDDSDDVIFNTVPGETQLAVGADPTVVADVGLSTPEFHAVIGSIQMDGVAVPLWSFTTSTPDCSGETAPTRPTVNGHMFRNGFAVLRTVVPSERTTTSLTVTFSAYSPSGLLYFHGSQESGDFVSLHLREGHVVFTVNLGVDTTASLESRATYDDGNQHTVKAIRGNGEVHLQVDSDADRLSSVLSGPATALNVEEDADHFVAGVPPDMDTAPFARHALPWRGFFGCIATVKPNQVTELDLERARRSYKKEPGCVFGGRGGERLVPSDRVVGFSKPGFLITPGVTIDNNSTLAFVFRTKEENGTLLFQSSKLAAFRRKQKREDGGGQGYIAFYLFRGFLVCHFGKDASRREGVVTIRSTTLYNDGLPHSVFFERIGQKVRVRVDDREIANERLSDESAVGRAAAGSQLFIGGFPEKSRPPNDEIPTSVPLIGCLSDIYHNYKRVPLVPEDHDNAQIGTCPMETHASNLAPEALAHPEAFPSSAARKAERLSLEFANAEHAAYQYDLDQDAQKEEKKKKQKQDEEVPQCGDGFESALRDGEDAVRFGIGQSSHGRLNFVDKESYPSISNFSFDVSLRTEEANGVVWVWANYKNYSRYFFLNVVDGLLTLEVKGHRDPKRLAVKERRVDDGQWHDVRLARSERKIELALDDLPPVVMDDAPLPKVMRRRMYVGGVISRHRQLRAFLPGFSGCMRSIFVNGRPKQLDASTSKDLIPCAPPTTKALYAHSGGYATFDGVSRHGVYPVDEVRVEFAFRGLQSDGLLFGIVDHKNLQDTHLIARMRGGQVFISLVSTPDRVELRDIALDVTSEGGLCDSSWHRISATIEKHRLVLTIDETSLEIPHSLPSAAISRFARLPLSLAGLPASLAQQIDARSLVGCYRDVHIAGQPVYFERAAKINRAVVDGCPLR